MVMEHIRFIVEREVPFLRSLPEEVVSQRFNEQHRSIKMLVGHMIDSASNNHQRMVRLQYAPRCGYSMPNTEMGMLVFPDYTQDNDLWIRLQDYQHEDWEAIVCLWEYYNLHVIQVIKSVDETKLGNYWVDYEGHRVTLQEMIMGYADHLELHVSQIHALAECAESPQK
ncbi:MAG: DinB family protein [Bacteroidaceae bacterium]